MRAAPANQEPIGFEPSQGLSGCGNGHGACTLVVFQGQLKGGKGGTGKEKKEVLKRKKENRY